ncbi:MAG: metallophosphoesterase family protein [Spirochaetota bacterium]|jgi:predicted phosphodiesterase|uniref:metallophosphoesterase family protein n=1 Tax=Rectinema subterraneum TaxID=2653714 RepID=UPI00131C617C|nr:metallophosphoesterase [Rectinema subterraneum]
MNQEGKKPGAMPARRTMFIAALVALVLGIIMNSYHYSLEGARGLYVWHPLLALKILLFMGLVPISIAIVSLPLEKLAKKWPMLVMRWISMAASILVGAVSIALLAFLIIVPRIGSLEPARLELIDPAKGIHALGTQPAEASFSAGTTNKGAAQPGIALQQPQSAALQPAIIAQARSPLDMPLLRLSFSSDPHWGADTSNAQARTQILESIAQRKPDAFFMLGDTVETGNSATQWNFALSDLEALIPHVPVRPLLGNHDALFGGQYLYRKAFFPKGFSSDSGSPYYWSIDAGAATIVAVDLPWGTENFGARQRAWLEKTLAAADPHKPLIVLSHSYFYASGYDDPDFGSPWYDHYQNIPALVPLFEKYGVDLVISGHNHYQELLAHNGIAYAIVGSMGGIPDPQPSYRSPWSQWLAVSAFGWLDVEVLPGRLVLVFRDERGAERHRAELSY